MCTRSFTTFPGLLLAASFLFACHSRSNLGGETVLVVNGTSYSATTFSGLLAKKLRAFDALAAKDPTNVKRAKESVIRELEISTLLDQYAREHHLAVSEDEVNDEFDKIRKTYPDDFTFKAAMASDGQTIEEWKAELRNSLVERKVFADMDKAAGIDEDSPALAEKAKVYYESHKNDFEHPAQIHIQQIVVMKEDDAERLLHKLKSGESFSEVAKKFSVSPDGPKGGDIGYLSKGTVPAFDPAFNLAIGQMSGVIKSSYGFHIMKVLDKRSAGLEPFEKAKKLITRHLASQLQQNVFTEWLDGAIKGAKIQRNDVFIDKLKIRTEGAQE